MSLRLHKLTLSLFRNHEATRLDFAQAGDASAVVVLTGANGAGKTNILEAISLLTPGKGLRGADAQDIARRLPHGGRDLAEGWAVAGEVEKADGFTARLGAGYDPRTLKRKLRVDGKDVRATSAFARHFSALWLTPQMDGLFIDSAASRRRFLDRMVMAYDNAHAARLTRYEKLQRERMNLLQARRLDDSWLGALEQQMAGEAVAITAARLVVGEHLQQHSRVFSDFEKLFPAPVIDVVGETEEALRDQPALAVEENYAVRLKALRGEDAARNRTTMGIHRSDMQVTYAAKNVPAALASTGEQKALLLSLVLAHAQMMRAEKGFVPVLLLDEVAAHLDDARRTQLFACLGRLGGQVFATGTDPAAFASCAADALCIGVTAGPGGTARLHVPISDGSQSRDYPA